MTLNFCEYNRFNQDYDRICRPSGSGDYLFLLLKTPMKVYLEDKLHITKENACILYTLQTPQHYQAVKRFCNSYLHFSSDINPCLRFGIPANTIFYPANYMEIDSLIRDLQQEYFSTADFREEYIHTLITQLFISISRTLTSSAVRSEDTGNLYPAFQSLRLQMLSDCQEDWTMERLCQAVNMEKSQFYVYYRQFFSTTPKNDLLQVRLEKAKKPAEQRSPAGQRSSASMRFLQPAAFYKILQKILRLRSPGIRENALEAFFLFLHSHILRQSAVDFRIIPLHMDRFHFPVQEAMACLPRCMELSILLPIYFVPQAQF
mgnify:CR=1 FL=1